jgi:hypothetical protein
MTAPFYKTVVMYFPTTERPGFIRVICQSFFQVSHVINNLLSKVKELGKIYRCMKD